MEERMPVPILLSQRTRMAGGGLGPGASGQDS